MSPSKVRTLVAFCALIALGSVGLGVWGALMFFAPERAFPFVPLLVPWGAVLAYGMAAVPDLCTGFEMELEDDELDLILSRREREG